MTSHSANNLKQAIVEVRHAYRLIASYQQRCFDTIRLISDQFEDRTFYQWTNAISEHTPIKGTNPFNRPIWDFNPLYIGSFLFGSRAEDSWSPRPGEWLLEIALITDDAVLKALEVDGYLDLSRFPDPLQTSSLMRLVVWKCIKSFEGKANWLRDVWNCNSWPNRAEVDSGNVVVRDDGRIHLLQIDIPIDELESREQVVSRIQIAKEILSSKLNIRI